MRISYINNNFVPHENAYVHIEDRGYQFADGVYEVVLARNNILLDWEDHCRRLRRSLSEMRIAYSFDNYVLKNLVLELITKNNLKDACVYLQISRGVAKREHGFPKGNVSPAVVITVSEPSFPSDKEYKEGVAVITVPDIRWKRRDIKTISLLPNILAKQQANEQNAVEAIFIEDDGSVTEGSSSNFFIFDNDGVLRTHPANNLILGGITRDGIIEVARKTGITVEEYPFRLNDVLSGKGAFISSTTKHILPVTKVNGESVFSGVCKEIQGLMKLYNDYVEKQLLVASN